MSNVLLAGLAHGSTSGTNQVSFVVSPFLTPTAVGVGIAWDDDSVFVLSVTYGGASMGAAQVERSSSDHGKVSIYGMVNPLDGDQTVVVTFTGIVPNSLCGAVAVAQSNTTTVFSNLAGNTGNGADQIAQVPVTSPAGELAFDVAVCLVGGTLGTGGHSLAWHTTGESIVSCATYVGPPHGTPVTFTHDIGNPDAPWADVAASFKLEGSDPPAATTIRGRRRRAHGYTKWTNLVPS